MQLASLELNGQALSAPPAPPVNVPVCSTIVDPGEFDLDDWYYPEDLPAISLEVESYRARCAAYEKPEDDLKAILRELNEMEKKSSILKRKREEIERERREERLLNLLRAMYVRNRSKPPAQSTPVAAPVVVAAAASPSSMSPPAPKHNTPKAPKHSVPNGLVSQKSA